MKIYVVTCGEYSDYHIVAVFTDREKAEKFIKVRNDKISRRADDAYNIEIYTANEPNDDNPYPTIYGFYYTSDYKLDGYYKNTDTLYYNPSVIPIIDYKFEQIAPYKTKVVEVIKGYKFDVMADDELVALKIAQDRIAEYKYRKEVEEKQ